MNAIEKMFKEALPVDVTVEASFLFLKNKERIISNEKFLSDKAVRTALLEYAHKIELENNFDFHSRDTAFKIASEIRKAVGE